MATLARDGDLAIRTMNDTPDDYRLIARWRAEPHVHEWWDPDEPPPDPEEAAAQYGARARGEEPTTACIVELGGRPIGYLQFYRWLSWPEGSAELDVRADPDTFGIDLFIGDPDLVGIGLGTRLVTLRVDTSRGTSRPHGSPSRPRPRTNGRSAPTRRRVSGRSERSSTSTRGMVSGSCAG